MKKILLFAMIIVLASCATGRTAGQKEQSAAKYESQIADSINNRTLTVNFDFVNPLRFPAHHLTTTYSLKIKGDSISSYLPYFGRAYHADYGSTDSPLSFNGHSEGMNITKAKKDSYRITFQTMKQQENFEYILTIFNNGKATLNVNSNERDPISFDGEVEIN